MPRLAVTRGFLGLQGRAPRCARVREFGAESRFWGQGATLSAGGIRAFR